MSLQTINPATGKLIREYQTLETDEVRTIIEEAADTQREWKEYSYDERAVYLQNIAGELRKREEELAELMAREMGKPLDQGRKEVEKCAWACEYYAEHTSSFLEARYIETEAQKSYITYNPIGLVLAIMPWNFPFWQLIRFGAPALMAGNGVLLKHAPNVTGCALEIEDIMKEAGLPEGLMRTLVIEVDKVKHVIDHSAVQAVSLTGSTRAGSAVAAEAGSRIKKSVLELGGSDPYVVLKDADLEQTVEACATSRLINSGQSCIAAKRYVVVDDLYDEFVERISDRLKKSTVGDPMDDNTDVGPQAREDLRYQLHKQVKESINQGAECQFGGDIPDGDGFFYPVTLLTDVKKGMPAYGEELFGPVASVIRVEDEEEAIQVANDTNYGLGAAIFTSDEEKGEQIAAHRLEAGCCFVNSFVSSDPRLPFGGIKNSGYGRELSHVGIKEFVNTKTVYVE